MFLSMIVPVYNAERYIGQCLKSLLDQDIAKEDYEILCINDGSRDGTLKILTKFSREHPNIRVINKENGGVTTARNAGLEAARGDYIWFIDADDLVRPSCLGRLQALTGPACDRIVFGAYQFTDEMRQEEWDACFRDTLPVNTPWYDAVVWRSLLRREFLSSFGLHFRYPELTHGEDGLFMYEVTLCDPRTIELGQVLYLYREHSGSAETAVNPENSRRKIRSYLRICQILRDYSRRQAQPTAQDANKLMSFLWMALYETAKLPKGDADAVLAEFREKTLFPFRRPSQCNMKKSYMTERTDLVGQCFDRVYLNLHRPWGYAAMRLLLKLKS